MIIAIDGPAGTGKSTVAREIAKKLHYAYFDTGAMYRALTWWLLEKGIFDLSDEKKLKKMLKNFHYDIEMQDSGIFHYFVDHVDVTDAIRQPKISTAVSTYAASPAIRHFLVPLQRKFAKRKKNIVVEGRDIGTVVFPKAELKIFLTASLEVRAKRRLLELEKKYPHLQTSQEKLLEEIKNRDEIDSKRKVSPLKCAEDAHLIDTSELSIDEVVNKILKTMPPKPSKHFPAIFKGGFFYGLVIFLAWSVSKIFYRHKIYGLEHFPKHGALLASNHLSFLDPPFIALSCPEDIHFLARESLFHHFFLGWLIKKVHTHPVARDVGDITTFKQLVKLLKSGKKILLFPEGTRSGSGKRGEILPGISFLSYQAKVPILPILIQGTNHIWPTGKKFPHLNGTVKVIMGSPIYFQDFEQFEKKEAMQAMAKALGEAFNNLEAWVKQGKHGSPP